MPPILGCNESNQVHKQTQNTDWLTVEDDKSINGWKTKSQRVRNWAVGLYEWRFAACVLCCALGWLRLARWFAVLGRASGILVSRVSPVVRPIQPWLCLWNCLFVSLFVCLILHSTLVFVCSGETHPGAKVWTWGAYIVKGASHTSHTLFHLSALLATLNCISQLPLYIPHVAPRGFEPSGGLGVGDFFSIGNYHTMSSINF
jgi:hypothetical protein